MSKLKAAAIQMTSGDDVAANLSAAGRLLLRAAEDGAQLAVLPENFAFMGAKEKDKLAHAEAEGSGPIQEFLADAARQFKLWIVAGTAPVAVPGDPGRVYAASLIYDAEGVARGRYDKIHLFDVDTPGGERYRESNSIAYGELRPAVLATPLATIGFSVCYDLRFPELFRALTAQGAQVLTVPSAFTEKTGEAHWEVLLRARAIENQCFVIAAGQGGTHPGGRRTWGHSMIVDPWGVVLAQCLEEGEGVALAELDFEALLKLRQNFPVLSHRRLA